MNRAKGRPSERGGVTIKGIISVVILVLLAHSAYVFIPIYIAVYDFRSQMETEANRASMKTDDAIYKTLLDYAKELQLPVTKKNLKVQRSHDKIVITADYTMEVPTLVYRYEWQISNEKTGILF